MTHEQLRLAGEALNKAQPYGIGAVMIRYAEAWQAETERLHKITQLDEEQADDEGLWFVATTPAEAYLQGAIQRISAAIKGE